MAFYPFATRKLIAPGPNDPPITAIGAILHVDGGNVADLYDYFKNKSGGIESHFHIPKDGPVIQMRDTAFEADANLKANSFIDQAGRRVGFVSIETQGLAAGTWNAWQLQQIKTLLKWLSETHSFPLSVCTSPTSPGVGYHIMFGSPGPWTPESKVCPGPDRIRQFENILTPWFNSDHAPTGGTPGKVDDLANADEVMAELKKFEAAETARYADIANRVQALLDAEAGRYADYVKRFDSILAATKAPK